MAEKHPCKYGGDHYDGEGGGFHKYDPDARNAIHEGMGAWVVELYTYSIAKKTAQVGYCSTCGAELPLRPRGEPLPNMPKGE